MPSTDATASASTVAILVVSDGAAWLPNVLSMLRAQTLPGLRVVAVDNASTDRSPQLLADALGEDRVVTLPQRVGFGRAIAAAIAADEATSRADRLLLVHDDLLLAPSAAATLSAALDADPTVGVVGPKLRAWSEEPTLVDVGFTIDRLGRLESPLEPGEVDQGQRDHLREVFAVSSAGMMVRREVLVAVGGFDARYPLFRDDLDLCWRARLAGWRVEVITAAVGAHLAAASAGLRDLGRRAAAREYAERHAVATLLKCYRLPHLLWVLPVLAIVAVAKVAAFLLVRRFAEAGAVLRAYGWNLLQLPLTLRRRRRVQARRRVADSEVIARFAPGLPRLKTYGEAVANWMAGGSSRALLDDERRPTRIDDVAGFRAWAERAARRPIVPVGLLLAAVYLVGVADLLGPGQIRGGTVAPWPASPLTLALVSVLPLEAGALASGAVGSPSPLLLSLLSLPALGNEWLAQRLVVLGAVPLAWVAALRALRLLTRLPGPRVLGATLYVLSPAVLGALARGALDLLAAAVLLPMVLSLTVRTAEPGSTGAAMWRRGALLALAVAAIGGLAPTTLPVAGAVVIAGAVIAVSMSRAGRWEGLARLLAAVGVGVLPLVPWLVGLVRAGWDVAPPLPAVPVSWWQALTAMPGEAPLTGGAGGIVTAAAAAAVLLAAVWLGWRSRPVVVAGLVLAVAVAGGVAWLLERLAQAPLGSGAPLLVAAMAYAGLAVLAARWGAQRLSAHAFGLRQIGTIVLALVVVGGLGVGSARLAGGETELVRGTDPLPAFVRGDAGVVGPYRVVLLDADEADVAGEAGGFAEPGDPDAGDRDATAPKGDPVVSWEVVEAHGPSIMRYGAVPDPVMADRVDAAVAALVGGVDPRGGGLLGAANVRYVVAPDLPPRVAAAVDRQPDLEPVPAGDVKVWQVTSWLPRAVMRAPGPGRDALAGDPGDARDGEEDGLLRVRAGRWAGVVDGGEDGGVLLVAEADADRWRAVGDGAALERVESAVGAGFVVPPGTERVAAAQQTTPLAWLSPGLLAAVLLGAASVALRPPGAARRRREVALAEPGLPTPPAAEASAGEEDQEPSTAPADDEPAVDVEAPGDAPADDEPAVDVEAPGEEPAEPAPADGEPDEEPSASEPDEEPPASEPDEEPSASEPDEEPVEGSGNPTERTEEGSDGDGVGDPSTWPSGDRSGSRR